MGCSVSKTNGRFGFKLHRDSDKSSSAPPVGTTVVFTQTTQDVKNVRDAIAALEDNRGRLSIMLAITTGRLQRSKTPSRARALEKRVKEIRGQARCVTTTIDTIRSTATSAVVTADMIAAIRDANTAISELSVDPDVARDVMQTAEDAKEGVDELAALLSAPASSLRLHPNEDDDDALSLLVRELDVDDSGNATRPVSWASGALEPAHAALPSPPAAGDAAAGGVVVPLTN